MKQVKFQEQPICSSPVWDKGCNSNSTRCESFCFTWHIEVHEEGATDLNYFRLRTSLTHTFLLFLYVRYWAWLHCSSFRHSPVLNKEIFTLLPFYDVYQLVKTEAFAVFPPKVMVVFKMADSKWLNNAELCLLSIHFSACNFPVLTVQSTRSQKTLAQILTSSNGRLLGY